MIPADRKGYDRDAHSQIGNQSHHSLTVCRATVITQARGGITRHRGAGFTISSPGAVDTPMRHRIAQPRDGSNDYEFLISIHHDRPHRT